MLLVMGFCAVEVSCTRAQTATMPQQDGAKRIQLVRDYSRNYHPAGDPSVEQHAENAAASSTNGDQEEAQYRSEVAAELIQKDFDRLEKTAREARLI